MTSSFVLPIEVEKLENGRFLATCSMLRGCLAEGDTPAEAIYNIEDVAKIIIELALEKGQALPEELKRTPPDKIRVQMTVAVER